MYFATEPLVVVAQSVGAWAEEGSWLKSQAHTKFGRFSISKGGYWDTFQPRPRYS